MRQPPLPPQETERLEALRRYEVLDTPPEKELDDLVLLAAHICSTPIAVISLVDSERQWFKSKIGLTATQTDRIVAFCSHTILGPDLLIVPDALADERFASNPLVTGDPHIRFYCGAPLTTPEGHQIGTLSVIDHVPRTLTEEQQEALRVLSRQVIEHLMLNRSLKELSRAHGSLSRAHETLRQSEDKFRTLNASSPSAIFIYRGDRILYANAAAALISGYSIDELVTMDMWKMGHPDFLPVLKARALAAQEGDAAPSRYEFKIIRKDGQMRWLDFTAATIDYEGQPARLATGYDITARKQAEAALQASEERFTLAVQGTDAGIWDWDLASGNIYFSARWKSMLGYDEQELPDVLKTWETLMHPADHERAMAAMTASLDGKTARYEVEHRLRHKDGSYRWILARGVTLRDATGKPCRMAGLHLDMTDRKRAESLKTVERLALELVSLGMPLSETMEFLVRSIESLSDGAVCSILLVDPDSRTLERGAVSTLPEVFSRAIDGAPIGPQNGSCGTAAYRKAPVVVTDIASDPLWALWPEARGLALEHGLKACTSVPIVGAQGDVLGTYAMYYRVARGPTEFESELLRASGQLLGIAIERARAEEGLRASEARLEAILDNSPLLVFLKDREGRYTFTNHEFERRFKLAPRQAIGKTDRDLFSPEQAAAFQVNDQEVFRAGMPIEFEEVAQYEDGARSSIVVKFPLRDADGTAYALCGMVTDITERKQAEEERRKQEALLALMLNTGPGCIKRVAADGTLLQMNPAGLGMIEARCDTEAIGRSVFDLVVPEHRDTFMAMHRDVINGQPRSWQFEIQGLQGTRRWMESYAAPFRNPVTGQLEHLAVTHDITDRKRAEEELQKSYHHLQVLSREVRAAEEKERTRLSRELHDEFGQLLSALKFTLKAMDRGLGKKPARTTTLAKRVTEATATVDRLFASLRELVAALRPAVLEELGLVAALKTLAAEVGERSGLRCRVVVERKGLLNVFPTAVEGALYRIAQELLTNVVRHAKATSVTISLMSADGWVRLVVEDDGKGFKAGSALPKGRFGLRGIQERAELFSGNVEIRSAPGRGTVVTVRLPVTLILPGENAVAPSRLPKPATARKRGRHGKEV